MISNYLINSITIFFNLYTYIVIIYVLLLIFSPNLLSKFTFIVTIVGPVLKKIRKIIPPFGFIDLSPIILIICLDLIKYLLISLIKMFE